MVVLTARGTVTIAAMYRWLKRLLTAGAPVPHRWRRPSQALTEISDPSTSPDFTPAEAPNASPLRAHTCAKCGRKRRNPISVRGGRANARAAVRDKRGRFMQRDRQSALT
jgi:hypothetical protein